MLSILRSASAASRLTRRAAPFASPSSSVILPTLSKARPPTQLPRHVVARHLSVTGSQHSPTHSSTPMAAQTDSEAAALSSAAGSAAITPESLTEKLQARLQISHVSIQDMSGGCGQAFTAVIVSPEFEKKTLLARHRLVNGALKDEIAAIHAWTPKCLTPEQWEKEKERANA